MADDPDFDRRQEDKELHAMLRQVRNAGFDMSTVDGQNKYRKSLETAYWIAQGKETGGGIVFKIFIAGVIGWLFVVLGEGTIVHIKKVLASIK